MVGMSGIAHAEKLRSKPYSTDALRRDFSRPEYHRF
jgi:hypothetical protein